MKKAIALALSLALSASLLAGCGGGGKHTDIPEVDLPAINEIKLGEDYQDITATVKVLTNRTDIVDTTYAGYAAQFHELYPNITVEYEGITDYYD